MHIKPENERLFDEETMIHMHVANNRIRFPIKKKNQFIKHRKKKENTI